MELSPLSFPGNSFGADTALSPLRPAGSLQKPNEEQQLKDSCRQFEAILWRSVMSNAKPPSITGEGDSADPTGTYQYFYNDTVANAVSGSSKGFADALYQQLSRHLHHTQPTPSSQPSA